MKTIEQELKDKISTEETAKAGEAGELANLEKELEDKKEEIKAKNEAIVKFTDDKKAADEVHSTASTEKDEAEAKKVEVFGKFSA